MNDVAQDTKPKGLFDRSTKGRTLAPVSVQVERGRIRFFAKSLGETDPIHFDIDAARAAGYPDLVASINVTINQTGQAIENVLIIMAAYLSVSLSISAFMNWYNKRIALTER